MACDEDRDDDEPPMNLDDEGEFLLKTQYKHAEPLENIDDEGESLLQTQYNDRSLPTTDSKERVAEGNPEEPQEKHQETGRKNDLPERGEISTIDEGRKN